MKSETIAKKIVAALDDLKGMDIEVLDVRKLTSITDFMIIANGTSSTHVKALAGKVVDTGKQLKIPVLGVEGELQGEWILVDLGDTIVHVMLPRTRAYYQLEKLWTVEQQQAQRAPG